MKLGEFVEKYIREHKISQRQFAKKCGMSSGYISMIVNGVNPRSNTPIVPTLKSLNGIARGMNMTIDELLAEIDDMLVDMSFDKNKSADSAERERIAEFVDLFAQLSDDQQRMLIMQMKGLLSE